MDFLAVVSRPDFPSGSGPVGDYYGFRRLIAAHPEWNAAVIELNTPGTEIDWTAGALRIRTAEIDWFDLADVQTVAYLPICLEPEETVLRCADRSGRWPQFEVEQWRPITALFESRLDGMTRSVGSGSRQCLNRPAVMRLTNNKLLQFEKLAAAGFRLPATRVRTGFPSTGLLASHPALVSKNVSEGGWRSPTEFSPAQVVAPHDPGETWPTIWQQPIVSDEELRVYVMGGEVTAVALRRDPGVLDVRSLNDGQPAGSIVELSTEWTEMAIGMARCLGLDYAVIDAIPANGTLHVLEVNANGVWWFLPTAVGAELESRFHRWIASVVNSSRT